MNTLDVACVGLNVVNFPVFPVDEGIFTRDVSLVSPITLLPGGDAANQAIVLSRLGAGAALLSARGDDPFGEVMLSLLRQAGDGLDLSGITVKAGGATGVCAMLIKPDGQRHFCTHRGALNSFGIDDIDLSVLRRVRVASIGGLFALPAFDGDGTAAFFKEAKRQGVVTVADTKADTRGIGLAGVRETLAFTDYFFPSIGEAGALTGETAPQRMAQAFLDAGVRVAGIKLGAQGVYLKSAENECFLPAFAADVVDTTGAGDNFMAGFICGLLRGWDARRCCFFGMAAAALCVSRLGPTTAVTSFAQVQAFLHGHAPAHPSP